MQLFGNALLDGADDISPGILHLNGGFGGIHKQLLDEL